MSCAIIWNFQCCSMSLNIPINFVNTYFHPWTFPASVRYIFIPSGQISVNKFQHILELHQDASHELVLLVVVVQGSAQVQKVYWLPTPAWWERHCFNQTPLWRLRVLNFRRTRENQCKCRSQRIDWIKKNINLIWEDWSMEKGLFEIERQRKREKRRGGGGWMLRYPFSIYSIHDQPINYLQTRVWLNGGDWKYGDDSWI